MRAPSAARMATLLGLCLGVVACSCGDKTVATPDAGVDARPADVGIDRSKVDASVPDLGKPGGCGGERTLSPIPIQPGALIPCGPGCQQVSWGASPRQSFEVADDMLTYVGLGFSKGFEVYYVNLAKSVEQRLHGDWPRVGEGCDLSTTDGVRIALTCVRDRSDSGAWARSITLFEPATKVEQDIYCRYRLAGDGGCSPSQINLCDQGVALGWSLGACAQGGAYYLPFAGAEPSNVAGLAGAVFDVHGQGSKVVWTQGVIGYKGLQIMVYDVNTGMTKHVDPHDGDQWMPRVQGDKIVWVDHRNDPTGSRSNQRNSDIYLHDLTTGKTTAVTTHPALQEWPDVRGDWVVWHDLRANPGGISGGNIDVYAKNIKTGEEVGIATTSESESYPRIDRDRIFYRSRGAIFMVDIAAFLAAKKTP